MQYAKCEKKKEEKKRKKKRFRQNHTRFHNQNIHLKGGGKKKVAAEWTAAHSFRFQWQGAGKDLKKQKGTNSPRHKPLEDMP